MTTFQDPNQKIAAIGANFDLEFGAKPVATKAVALNQVVLGKPMTSDEILANFKINPVALSDVYSSIGTLDTKSDHLFFVQDDQSQTQAVFIFQENGKCRIVSPTSDQASNYHPGVIIWTS